MTAIASAQERCLHITEAPSPLGESDWVEDFDTVYTHRMTLTNGGAPIYATSRIMLRKS